MTPLALWPALVLGSSGSITRADLNTNDVSWGYGCTLPSSNPDHITHVKFTDHIFEFFGMDQETTYGIVVDLPLGATPYACDIGNEASYAEGQLPTTHQLVAIKLLGDAQYWPTLDKYQGLVDFLNFSAQQLRAGGDEDQADTIEGYANQIAGSRWFPPANFDYVAFPYCAGFEPEPFPGFGIALTTYEVCDPLTDAECKAVGEETVDWFLHTVDEMYGLPPYFVSPSSPESMWSAERQRSSTILTLATSGAHVRKDPHIWFAEGGRADIRGEDGAVYNLLSARNASFNVRIKHADFQMHHTLLHGSYMDAAFFTLRTASSGRLVTVSFNATHAKPSATVLVGAPGASMGPQGLAGATERHVVYANKGSFVLENLNVSVADRAVGVKVAGKWALSAAVAPFPYGKKNAGKTLLDVRVDPLSGYVPHADTVPPHGIVGQSFDGDNVGIDGATDPSAVDETAPSEMTTSANAEGAIEGVLSDYRLSSSFATSFKYGRFDAVKASPRNTSLLTGKRASRPTVARLGAGVKSSVEEATAA